MDIKLDQEDIKKMDRIYRLNLINSLSGIKPANLIGTRSNSGINNLAIFCLKMLSLYVSFLSMSKNYDITTTLSYVPRL